MKALQRGIVSAGLLGIVMLLGTGCTSQSLLLANFNSDTVGAAPSGTQEAGTVAVDSGSGTARVAVPPPNATTNWVEINHPITNTAQTAMQAKFSQFRGDGNYGLLAVLFVPSGCGTITLQFEPAQNGPTTYTNFLHLDFMPNNTVRIDDGAAVFGTFPRDQFFTVSVRLNVTPSGTTAQMQLFGEGASGNLDYSVMPPFTNLARQIGSVRFWMGFPHAGAFKIDDIIVSYTAP